MRMIHGGNTRKFPGFIDFSANINPLGMPENVRRAAIESASEWIHYPDPDCSELCSEIADKFCTSSKRVLCGNGADDLIYRIICTVKPRKALIPVPAFSEYQKFLNQSVCNVQKYVLSELNNFQLDSTFLSAITSDTEMVILCSPNNPTGLTIPEAILADCAERCKRLGAILMCDESFIGFVPEDKRRSILPMLNENCILLSSMTKLYAIPGLRIGYALFGSQELASVVKECGQFWPVSAPAMAAGIAALNCHEFEVKTVHFITQEREFLVRELSELGVKVFPSEANFLLIKSVEELDDLLLNSKILIRNCSNFDGLSPQFFRIAVRSHEDNLKFLNAVRRCLNG